MKTLKEKLLEADMLLIDVDGVIGNLIHRAGINATWNGLKNSLKSYRNFKLFTQMLSGDISLVRRKLRGDSELELFDYFINNAFKNCPIDWLKTKPKNSLFKGVEEFMEKISNESLTKIMVSRNISCLIEPYKQYLRFEEICSNQEIIKKEEGNDVLKGIYLNIRSSKKEATSKILSNYPCKKRFIVIGQYDEDIGMIEAVNEKKDKEYLVSVGFNPNKKFRDLAEINVKNWKQLEDIIK